MSISEKISERAERLLFRMACATCPLQNSCGGACHTVNREKKGGKD